MSRDRDEKGRFVSGHKLAHLGHQAMVERHFGGDTKEAARWFTAMGLWVQDTGYRQDGKGLYPTPPPHPAWQNGNAKHAPRNAWHQYLTESERENHGNNQHGSQAR